MVVATKIITRSESADRPAIPRHVPRSSFLRLFSIPARTEAPDRMELEVTPKVGVSRSMDVFEEQGESRRDWRASHFHLTRSRAQRSSAPASPVFFNPASRAAGAVY